MRCFRRNSNKQAIIIIFLFGSAIILLQFSFLVYQTSHTRNINGLPVPTGKKIPNHDDPGIVPEAINSAERRSKDIVAADMLNDEKENGFEKNRHENPAKVQTVFQFPNEDDPLEHVDYNSSHPLENECRFPILHNDEPDLEIHVKHYRAVRCPQSNFVPLVTQLRNGEILFGKPHRSKLEKTLVRCYAREIGGALRPKHRTVEEIGDMIELPPNRRVNVQWQQFMVKCYSESQDLLFHDVFTNVPVTKPASNHLLNIQKPKPYSISIFIIDSASRNQFSRHMPLTLDFMKQNGFEILHGYTKVGDNSAINLLPILAGMIYEAEERGFHSLYPENMVLHSAILRNSSDDFWQHIRSVIQIAKKNGYVTMWNDDIATSGFGLFHYKAFKGFTQPPTDYYYRPYYEYIYQNLDAHSGCVNGQFVAPRYIDIWERFVTNHINSTHFAFNFLTGLTHSSANNIELYDNSLSESLERLKTRGAFENSVVLIMGDHGQRIVSLAYLGIVRNHIEFQSSIQKTHSGRVEERMPMMGIYLPERFKTDHPAEYGNLLLNKNRLTSNFDIYETLMDTLAFSGIQDSSRSRRMQPPAGISLFDKIPVDRSCEDARIPPQFCCCLQATTPNVDMESRL
ncbi:sulfatase domain-containing protein [Ditylenchus destructor]|nr:sulfatase domain-containing protein [Ditylenchus destructor]